MRRGESLWTIARRNHTDPRTLMRLNNMRPGATLRAGERLIVSPMGATASIAGTSRASGSDRSVASAAARTSSARTVRHTVRRGDTLSQIARVYQVSVTQIVAWNGIATSTTLRPGQKLSITLARRH